MSQSRPLADRLEIAAPEIAALLARAAGRLPAPVRSAVLQSAFDRARDAFNRGDMEAVFALFATDVEYGPPAPLCEGGRAQTIHGRGAVFEFWRMVRERFDVNTIENLSLEEATPGRFVRRARLRHRSSASGEQLEYVIVQTTELQHGRVARQVNVLERDA
ncbi:MAG TPA: nuclear transport factor 2 family protein [Solirubrobacteraceae bacterium]|nr:nuclear transport factor 2 family protein [Solirubrobacteraceae bacterium]